MGDWAEKQTIGLLPERAARWWGPREVLAFQCRRWTFTELHARVVSHGPDHDYGAKCQDLRVT